MRSLKRTGRSIRKAVPRELGKVKKAAVDAGKQARETVEDTGETIRKSGRKILAAGALAAMATGAAVEVARRRQAASEPEELPLEGGADERGLRGVAHRALDSMTDLASQIVSSVMPGNHSDDGKSDRKSARNGSGKGASSANGTAGPVDPDLPQAQPSGRRKYMDRVNRQAREEFDRSWEA